MDESLEKSFVQEMRNALQTQLSEFELAKKKEEHDAKIVAHEGARRWRKPKDSLKSRVEEISAGNARAVRLFGTNSSLFELTWITNRRGLCAQLKEKV